MKNLVLATHNQGKANEFAKLFEPHNIKIISAAELNLPEPDETGATFAENAIIKAQAAAKASNLPALADDSGLSVTALGGKPGIYSARWAPKDKNGTANFNIAMQRINDEIGLNPNRSAAFICVLALAAPNGDTHTFEGRINGQIIWPARGNNGFGYDPIFTPENETKTFAEMTLPEKQNHSHRQRAFEKLVENIEII